MDVIALIFMFMTFGSLPFIILSFVNNGKNLSGTRYPALFLNVLVLLLFIGAFVNCLLGLVLSGYHYDSYDNYYYFHRSACSWVGMGLAIGAFVFGIISLVISKALLNRYRSRLNKNSNSNPQIQERPAPVVAATDRVEPAKENNASTTQAAKTNNVEPKPAPQRNSNYIEEIKALKELLDCGAITQEEYDAKKKQILNI